MFAVKVTFRDLKDDCGIDRVLRVHNDQSHIKFLAFISSFHALLRLFRPHGESVEPLLRMTVFNGSTFLTNVCLSVFTFLKKLKSKFDSFY